MFIILILKYIIYIIIYFSSFAMYSSHISTVSLKPFMNIFTKRSYHLNARWVVVLKRISSYTLMKLPRIICPFWTTTSINYKYIIKYYYKCLLQKINFSVKKYLQIIYFIMIRMFLIKESAYIINMIPVYYTF